MAIRSGSNLRMVMKIAHNTRLETRVETDSFIVKKG